MDVQRSLKRLGKFSPRPGGFHVAECLDCDQTISIDPPELLDHREVWAVTINRSPVYFQALRVMTTNYSWVDRIVVGHPEHSPPTTKMEIPPHRWQMLPWVCWMLLSSLGYYPLSAPAKEGINHPLEWDGWCWRQYRNYFPRRWRLGGSLLPLPSVTPVEL